MRLVQFFSGDSRHVGVVDGDQIKIVSDAPSVLELALRADIRGESLATIVEEKLSDETVSYDELIAEKRLLPPLDHPDPAHCYVTGTGLTHLGSAKARDSFHSAAAAKTDEPETDSMRLFRMGLDGGKPGPGKISVQPEWFYKGNGGCIAAPEHELPSPPFAMDAGEESELVGLYVIGQNRRVLRVGFAIGNEFSDHVMERQNYLYLAHSKLRACSFGPELLVGDLPDDIQGQVRIVRDGTELWQDSFLTGEKNMSYTIANLEHHHFKYPAFRVPGDVHCHYFGTATLSISAGIEIQSGDRIEISAPEFGRPLRNTVTLSDEPDSLVECFPL
jgi:hypothetical protein